MKIIKRVLISLLILLLLTMCTVFVLVTFYKKEMANLIVVELNEKYGLQLQVESVSVSFLTNWPQTSVELENVVCHNEGNVTTREPLLKATSIAISFDLKRMLHREFIAQTLTIKGADVLLLRNIDGTENFSFKNQNADDSTSDTESSVKFELDRIVFKNCNFQFRNLQRPQNLDFAISNASIRLKHFEDGIEGNLLGKFVVSELLFNKKKGAFLEDQAVELDLRLAYFRETKSICILPSSTALIADQLLEITSIIETNERKRLALIIDAKKVDFNKTLKLLTPKIQKMLANFDVQNGISGKVLLVINIGKREEPVLIIDLLGQNNSVSIGNSKIPYSDVWFKGKIVSLDSTGQCGDGDNATVKFTNVRGKLYDFPFTATISVKSFSEPFVYVTAGLLVESSKIKFDVAQDFVLQGSTFANVKYSGPASNLNSHEFLDHPMNLQAVLTFKNMSYREMNRDYLYKVNGKALVSNKDLSFKNLNLNTVFGDVVLTGKAENFVNYVLGFSKGFKAKLDARSDKLDFNPLFQNPEIVSTRENQAKDKKKKQATVESITKAPQSKFEFDVQLFAKKMLIRKLEAQSTTADLHYKTGLLELKSVNFLSCDGMIFAKGTLQDFNKFKADATVVNVNVNKLFTQCENFGQEAVLSENLKGTISLEAKFSTELDAKMGIVPETIKGDVSLKLRDGHLLNFEPIKNLSNFLFKNRDFQDVAFSELREKFILEGYRMEIQELEVASNVLNLYVVDGIYNFKGNSSINILVPWNNLRKRERDHVPKSSGISAEDAKGIKLNFHGPNKKMKISMGHKKLGTS